MHICEKRFKKLKYLPIISILHVHLIRCLSWYLKNMYIDVYKICQFVVQHLNVSPSISREIINEINVKSNKVIEIINRLFSSSLKKI
jgi:hypothetical protein